MTIPPSPIPEPEQIAHYLPPAIWAMVVGYLVQAAAVVTLLVVARLGLHIPADLLSSVAQIEVAGAVAVAAGALGSGLHSIGAKV